MAADARHRRRRAGAAGGARARAARRRLVAAGRAARAGARLGGRRAASRRSAITMAASPSARSAILEWLGLKSVQDRAQGAHGDAAAAPLAARRGARAGPARCRSTQARRRAGLPVRVPARAAAARRRLLRRAAAARRARLARLPPAAGPDALAADRRRACSSREWRATRRAGDREGGRATARSSSACESTATRAYFISGAPHGVAWTDENGDVELRGAAAGRQHAARRARRRAAAARRGRASRATPQCGSPSSAALERLAAHEAGLDRVPVRDGGLLEQPAEVDLLAVAQRRGSRSGPASRSRTTMSRRPSCSRPSVSSTVATARSHGPARRRR